MQSSGVSSHTADAQPGVEDLIAFGRIFVLILVTEHWTRALALRASIDLEMGLYAALATVLGGLAWLRRRRRLAFAGLAVVQLLVVRHDFPQAGNHAYLGLILCLALAFLDPRVGGEDRLLRQSVCWLTATVLFWSGMQKIVHGYYFEGEQLAYAAWIDSFRPVLAMLMPAEELARLVGYGREVGDGPYRVAGAFFIAVSNGVYIAELLLAAMLGWRRTRMIAVFLALVLLVCVEAAARELFFGLLFANSLLLFWPRGLHRKALGVFAVVLFCLLLVRAGILPEMVFY
jgi:hypothetical protein